MPPYAPTPSSAELPVLVDIVRCAGAFGILEAENARPAPALLALEPGSPAMKLTIIAASIAGGIAALLTVLLVLTVILLRRTRAARSRESNEAKCTASGSPTEAGEDTDGATSSRPCCHPGDTATRPSPLLPPLRISFRESQPPPYRSRQGSETTTAHSDPHGDALSSACSAPPMRRPSETGVGVHFHLPFQGPLGADLAARSPGAPALAYAAAHIDPCSPFDAAPPVRSPEREQDITESVQRWPRTPLQAPELGARHGGRDHVPALWPLKTSFGPPGAW